MISRSNAYRSNVVGQMYVGQMISRSNVVGQMYVGQMYVGQVSGHLVEVIPLFFVSLN